MATVKLELEVPSSLSDIKLWQYQKYLSVLDKNKGEDEGTVNFLNMKLVEIFCDVSLKEVESIPLKEYEKVLSILNEAFKEEPKLIRRFELEGVDMGFLPRLEDMSLGEYIDAENNIYDWQNIHKAMAVLYRPVNFNLKDKYTIAPYSPTDELQNIMKNMPLDVVMSSMVFFYDLGNELLKAIPNYLEEELNKKENIQVKQTLEENGVGINQYTHLLKGMSQSLTKLHRLTYLSV
jgi:hypothetical protein